MQYPYDWEIHTSNKVNNKGFFDYQVPLVLSPDSNITTFELTIADLPFEGLNIRGHASLFLDTIRKEDKNFDFIESNATTLDGNPAYKLVFTHGVGQDNMISMYYITIISDKLYLLSYNALESNYYKFLPTVQKMIESFVVPPRHLFGSFMTPQKVFH